MDHLIVLLIVALFASVGYGVLRLSEFTSTYLRIYVERKLISNKWPIKLKITKRYIDGLDSDSYSIKVQRFNNVYYAVDIQPSHFEKKRINNI